jgi:hypothetical protein
MEGLLFVSAFLNASSPYQVTTDWAIEATLLYKPLQYF